MAIYFPKRQRKTKVWEKKKKNQLPNPYDYEKGRTMFM